MNKLELNNTIFENIKHIDEEGNEYWSARELKEILNYKEWRTFENVISKAKNACLNSNVLVNDHFVDVHKMVIQEKKLYLLLKLILQFKQDVKN